MLSYNSSFSSRFIFGLCGLSMHLLSTILRFKSAYCFSSKFLGHYSRTVFLSMNVILCDSIFFSMSTPFSFPTEMSFHFISFHFNPTELGFRKHHNDHSLHTSSIPLLSFLSITLEWQHCRPSYTNPICFTSILLCSLGML